MANLLSNTTIGGYQSIHTGNIGSYAITSIPTSFSSITVTSSFNTASNDIYASMRVIRNDSAITDGMYIGYGNSGSGITRIFGGGSTGGALEKYATYTVEPGSFRAPIFYDSVDTSYYLDPNSTSYLYHLVLSGNSYFRPNSWIQFDGNYGVYWPNHYGLHIYPNQSSYGSLQVKGSKAGWHGIHFDSNNTLMVNANESGFHNDGYGWQFRWTEGTMYVHRGTYGGGTAYTVLDSGNASNFMPTWGAYSWTSPVFGQYGIKSNLIDNVLYSAADRFEVFRDGAAWNTNCLFNLNYDQNCDVINAGTSRTYSIILNTKNNPSSGITYTEGNIYLSFYYVFIPGSVSGRVRFQNGNWVAMSGWTNVANNGSYAVWRGNVPGGNYMVEIEITINANSSNNTWFAQWEYVMGRPGQYELGVFNKAQDNSVWRSLYFRDSSNVARVTINSGGISANTVTSNNFNVSNAIYFGGGNNYLNWTNSRIYTNVGIESADSLRAPIFYDSQDSNYYADFNSTVNNAIRVRGGMLMGPNPTWGAYLQVGGDGNNSSYATMSVTNGNIHIDPKNGYNLYLNHYYGSKIYFGSGGSAGGSNHHSNFSGGGNLNLGGGESDASYRLQVSGTGYASSDFRAPIFYDSQDTGYYLDPNSNSNLASVYQSNSYASNYFQVESGRSSGGFGGVALFRATRSAATDFPSFSFVHQYGNHSWGQIARFHIEQSGVDRPSIQFSSGSNNTRWNVGYCNPDDLFRISQNMGYRPDGSGVTDGWGTERFKIDTSGNTYAAIGGTLFANGSAVITAANISSQSVSYATTAGALSSMNISQFTNNSGYITSSSLSSYLPLSGGTLTGDLTFVKAFGSKLLMGSGTSESAIGNGGIRIGRTDTNYTHGTSWSGTSSTMFIDCNDVATITIHDSGHRLVEYMTYDGAGTNTIFTGRDIGWGTTNWSFGGNVAITGSLSASGYNKSNWDTAYSWGNHASAGYISTSYLDDYTRGSYRVISDYGGNTTWYLRGNGQFIWGLSHDWSYSFRLNLPSGSQNNTTWAYFGQQDSNAGSGTWRGVRIRKYASGSVDGDLSAGAFYIGDTRKDQNWDSAYSWGNHASAGYVTSSALSSYVPLSGATLTEGNYFYFRSNRGSYLGALDSPSLQVYASGGNAAFMSFHRGGNYAVNFGLDSDNVMRIGGWSAAADRWVLDMSGNNTVAGSFRAPIFYDSANTNFYGDFASTSVMNSIRFGTSTNNATLSGASTWGVTLTTDAGWIQFGPANGSWAHIYASQSFYFNQDLYVNGNVVITSATIGSQSVSYASTAGSADQIDGRGFVNTGSNNATYADSINSNGISYVAFNISLLGQTDGALYSQAYDSAWQHQIYGDYRTGQIVVRGKLNGTWQAWRTVIDSSTIGSQSVSYATTAGTANAVAWGNVSSKPSLVMYYQGFTLDANTMDGNSTGFTYSVNAPYTGPIARFSETGYSLQLNAAYSGGGTGIAFRTRNGDAGSFNPWRVLLNDANYTSYSPSLTGSGASGTWGINVTGSAGSVAWTNVSSRPTNLSQFTNDLGNYGGFLTSITAHTHAISDVSGLQTALDGKQAAGSYLTTSGKAADSELFDGTDSIYFVKGNGTNALGRTTTNLNGTNSAQGLSSGFYDGTGMSNMPTSDWYHLIVNSHYNSATTNQYEFQLATAFWDKSNFYVRSISPGDVGPWRTLIHNGNIGSQSVNYANSAGSASSATTATTATVASQLNKFGDIYGQDWNSYYIQDKFIASAVYGHSGANRPNLTYDYGVMLSYGETSGPLMQMYFPENSPNLGTIFRKATYRTGWNGNWSTWKTLVEQEGNTCTIVGGNQTGMEIHANVGYNQDPLTYFLLRGQADTSWKALKIRLTGDAGGQDIEFRRIAENGADARMFYVPRGANQVIFEYQFVQGSDSRLKDNIIPITNSLDKVKSLRGVEFDWNSGVNEGTHDVGLIAQEVEAVLPEAVTTQEDGYKNLAYTKVIPLLVEAMKEQQVMIDALKAEIELLKNK